MPRQIGCGCVGVAKGSISAKGNRGEPQLSLKMDRLRLLISGSKVRILVRPPIKSITYAQSAPDFKTFCPHYVRISVALR